METMSTAQDLENIGVGPTCETVNAHQCWCHVGALQMCVICVSVLCLANRAFTADQQRESARCVSNTRRGIAQAVADPPRECAMDETTPMKLSSL